MTLNLVWARRYVSIIGAILLSWLQKGDGAIVLLLMGIYVETWR